MNDQEFKESAAYQALEKVVGPEDADKFSEILGTLENALGKGSIHSFGLFISTPNPEVPALRFCAGNGYATAGIVQDYLDDLRNAKIGQNLAMTLQALQQRVQPVHGGLIHHTRNGHPRG